MNAKKNVFSITLVKWAVAAVLVIILAARSLGNTDSKTAFEDMSAAVLSAADMTNMQEADNQMVRRLYGLDSADYAGFTLYYPTTNMGAEELLLVQFSDPTQKDTIKEAVEARLETQKKSFAGYGADQTAMLENSIVDIRGNYALFVSAADPDAVEKAFDSTY